MRWVTKPEGYGPPRHGWAYSPRDEGSQCVGWQGLAGMAHHVFGKRLIQETRVPIALDEMPSSMLLATS